MDETQGNSGSAPETDRSGAIPAAAEPRERWYRVSIAAMALVIGLFSPAAFVFLGWFTEAYQDTEAASEVSHRLHEVVFGILFSLALVGALSQWRRPRDNLAGLIQLAGTLGILSLVVIATVGWDPGLLLYMVPLAPVLLLRPTGVARRSGPMWWWALFLTAVAVPPLADDIAGHLARAQTSAQNHTTHWSAMAAFASVLLGLGIVVSMRVTGYRLVAASLGASAMGYGLAAAAYPFDASSHRPAYSIGLVVWGLAWLLSMSFFDRARQGSRRPLLASVSALAMALGALLAGTVWLDIDTPPNVPHRPQPNQALLTASDVDRQTCLDCHQTGTAGAPIPPHDFGEACTDDHCWGGRTDCVGCHQIDPELGGPGERLEAAHVSPIAQSGSQVATPSLTDHHMSALRRLVSDP